MTVAVRSAGPADMGAVMAVMADAFDPMFGEAWTEAQCRGILGVPGVWLDLACAAATPAGFALSRIVADEAELLLLAVATGQRRAGVGRRLLARVAGEAASRGARRLFLEVRAGNAAFHLYHAAGFVEVGRRPGYYRGGDGRSHDAITLQLDLPARAFAGLSADGESA